jgi:endonuclease III
MRREGVARDAPTDRTGAAEIGKQIRQATPHVYRFQTLAGLILSAQTKDPDTAKAVAALRAYWEGRGGFTPDNVLATDVRTLTKIISDATYAEKKAEYVSARDAVAACNLQRTECKLTV